MKLFISMDSSYDASKQEGFYGEPREVNSEDDLRDLVRSSNHAPAKFRNGYRNNESWLSSECLIQDVDRGCSIEDFCSILNKFKFYIATSRHHQQEKMIDGKIDPPCDRYHVYFPLSKEYSDKIFYSEMLITLNEDYSFFDHAVKDLARFMFKSGEDVLVHYHEGECIDLFLSDQIKNKSIEVPPKDCVFIRGQDYKAKLLSLLSQAAGRGIFDEYSAWIRLGMGLKNAGYGLSDWQSLSWEGIEEKVFERHWKSFNSARVTEGSLIFWAREIEPDFLVKGAGHQVYSCSEFDEGKLHVLHSDADFCERFIEAFGEEIRFVKGLGWARYNGKNWDVGIDQNEMYRMVVEVATECYEEEIGFLNKTLDENKRESDKEKKRAKVCEACLKGFMAAKVKYQNRAGIQSALEILSGQYSILCESKEFNRGNNITLQNGVYDLDTCTLISHSANLMTATISDFSFDPNAVSTLWSKFIFDVFMGRTDIIEFIQVAIGYCLCSSVSEEKVFFAFGAKGANGKSTFFNILYAIFGTAAKTIASKVLMDASGDEAREQLAQLINARFVRSTEIKKGARFDESVIKSVSGKDTIRCRALYHSSFEYYPRFKLWIFGNHKPGVDDNGRGFWRRLVLIPFDREFEEEEQDKQLEDKLLQELPGIFNWALEGYKKYKELGLIIPDSLKKLVEQYQSEENKVLAFLQERTLEVWDRLGDCGLKFSKLYEEYKSYCEDCTIYPLSKNKFSQALEPLQEKMKFKMDYGTGNVREITGRIINEGAK